MRYLLAGLVLTIISTGFFITTSNNFYFTSQTSDWNFPCLSYVPTKNLSDTKAQKRVINEDLAQIASITSCIRIYAYDYPYYLVPEIATEHKIEVIGGIWIEKGKDNETQKQIGRIIRDSQAGQPFRSIIVGNETLQLKRGDQDDIYRYLKQVKDKVDVPVSIAEPSSVWLKRDIDPKILDSIDFISINMLQFWWGLPADRVVGLINEEYTNLKDKYDKPLFISEMGWPSFGQQIGHAVPSTKDQHIILSNLEKTLLPEIKFYNVLEAYDAPWKMFTNEGLVGAHWGIFNNDRAEKYNGSFQAQTKTLPSLAYALVSIVFGFILIFLAIKDKLRFSVFIYISTAIQLVIWCNAYVIWKLYEIYITYNLIQTATITTLLCLSTILITFELFGVYQTELYKRRKILPQDKSDQPFISIHIPTKNERPEIVIEALQKCLRLDYSNYEIIVVSNNCTDKNTWEPIQKFCASENKIKFFHFDYLENYKSGALNFALSKTDSVATWVAVVDADYNVLPNWLSDATKYIMDDISVVQMPQHYRQANKSYLEEVLIAENNLIYQGGNMAYRDAYNAAILHGTMCLVRKKDLIDIGSWLNTSIAEDADLGLRLVSAGKKMISIPLIYGSGLTPQNVQSLLNQRFRWSYGAIRICIEQYRAFISKDSKLNSMQKIFYILGWLPWFAQILYPVLVILFIVNIVSIYDEPKNVIPGEFYLPIILLTLIYISKLVYICTNAKIYSVAKIASLTVVHAALTPTIAYAVLLGFFKKTMPFKSTHSLNDSLQSKVISFAKHTIRLGLLVFSAYVFYIIYTTVHGIYKPYSFADKNIALLTIAMVIMLLPLISYYILTLFLINKKDIPLINLD